MKYLLDTNAISDDIHARSATEKPIQARTSFGPAISAFTVRELMFGTE